jgi:GAF domain-containing protein
MADAVESREPVVLTDEQEQSVLAVPLLLGPGVVTGAIGLRRAGKEGWDDESIALARAVSEQVAQTLETRRLFHELSWRAQRESILRQTSERLRAQANLDAVLQTALKEMQRITGATHVAIRLGTETQLQVPEDQGTPAERDE